MVAAAIGARNGGRAGITALTGSPAQIAAAAAQFDAAYARNDGENGHYTYDHSVKAYLIGVDQHLFATLDLNSEPTVRRNVLQRLLPD
jgi:cytochrome oxidase Cu insertion factor (SCO1/SenC/PrrC family)